MFEGSLVESRGLVAAGSRRWTAVGSVTIQCVLAGVLIAIPLLRPQVLRIPAASAPLMAPFLRRPPVVVRAVNAAVAAAEASVPAAGGPAPAAALGRAIWPHPVGAAGEDAPAVEVGIGMGGGMMPLANGLGDVGTGPRVTVVRTREPGPVTISKGVTEGLLLAPIRPAYPAIARAAGVQGTVVMEAVISKAGRIESLHALSGPAMLQRAALDAVSEARYRPYLLNGEPTEVKTTITVVFTLGG
jgi:protein TonB